MGIIITLLIYLIILGVVWYLGNYILDNIPLPGPVSQIGKVVLTVIVVILAVYFLIGVLGSVGSISLPKISALALPVFV